MLVSEECDHLEPTDSDSFDQSAFPKDAGAALDSIVGQYEQSFPMLIYGVCTFNIFAIQHAATSRNPRWLHPLLVVVSGMALVVRRKSALWLVYGGLGLPTIMLIGVGGAHLVARFWGGLGSYAGLLRVQSLAVLPMCLAAIPDFPKDGMVGITMYEVAILVYAIVVHHSASIRLAINSVVFGTSMALSPIISRLPRGETAWDLLWGK